MKFTIYREQWFRGQGSLLSKLWRQRDDKKCCLGFFAEALGYTKEDLCEKPTPLDVDSNNRGIDFPRWVFKEANRDQERGVVDIHSVSIRTLIKTNDNVDISDYTRESAITAIFAENGVEVEFV